MLAHQPFTALLALLQALLQPAVPAHTPPPITMVGHYNLTFVLLSMLLAVLSAYSALDLGMRVRQSKAPGTRVIWLGCGALALGSGIWSMHYIGMLAFQLPVPVTYDLGGVALSLLVAVLASGAALLLATRRTLSLASTAMGSVCMGCGIVGMHYIGMAAMRMAAMPVYSTRTVLFSVALAVVIAFIALRATFANRDVTRAFTWRKLTLATVMGAAIPCVHYVGMSAASWQAMNPDAMGAPDAHTMVFSVWGVLSVPLAAGALLWCMVRMNGKVEAMFSQQIVERRTSEERYRRILGAAFDAFIGISPEGLITDWNEQAAFTFGWTAEEAIGRSVDEMLHFRADQKLMGKAESVANQKFTQFLDDHTRDEVEGRIEVEGRHKTGVVFPAEMALSVLEVDGTRLVAAFVHDVTERKLAEQQTEEARRAAEAANQAKSEFLANMSHEIRTPLNGIIGMNDLVLDTELTQDQRECLETVRLSADLLLSVISDVLDFSKIEAGKVELENVRFDLRECVETTLKTLAFRADEKNLELLCDIGLDVPEAVFSDPARLRQIVTNLVGNAVKFTAQGEIAVRVRTSPLAGEYRPGVTRQALHFTVSDTGIGIPGDKLDAIFDAFKQADTSTTRQFGGTGLGLTISRHLVEMLDGRIWVESQAGRGSQFHFVLPMEIATPIESVTHTRPRGSLAGIKALIIDDNRTNRRILEGLLTRWQMYAVSAADGPGGLRELHREAATGDPFRLVLTDMHMPEMDGFTFVQQLKANPHIAAPTVMMLSSGGHRGDSLRCQELGIAAYLLKPVRQSELQDAIARALDIQPDVVAEAPPKVIEAAAVHMNGTLNNRTGAQMITRETLRDEQASVDRLDVLLAEDNEVNRKLAVRVLERRGHKVSIAVNGREAVEQIERRAAAGLDFDMVLMDVQMPEMGGIEATTAVRERERAERRDRHQLIVAMTALVMKGDRERCLRADMDGYLSKPFRPEELDAVLERGLAAKRERLEAIAATRESHAPTRAGTRPASEWDDAVSQRSAAKAVALDAAAQESREVPAGPVLVDQPPPPATDPRESLDDQDLLARIGGDTELLGELAEILAGDAPKKLAALRAAIATRDAAEVRATAHSLKGALANLAARRAAAQAAELEAMGAAGDLHGADALVRRLEAELTTVLGLLKNLCTNAANVNLESAA